VKERVRERERERVCVCADDQRQLGVTAPGPVCVGMSVSMSMSVSACMSAEIHPDAESLYVEMIDDGEVAPRQVVCERVRGCVFVCTCV